MKAIKKNTLDNAVDQAKETGGKIAEQARVAGGSLADQAKEAGSQLLDQAKEAAESGKNEVAQIIGERKEQAAEAVHSLDQALRETAERVDNPGLSRQIERLADGVEQVATALDTAEYSDVIASVERLSRQNPTLFLAAGFGIGLAISRFLRSSSPNRI